MHPHFVAELGLLNTRAPLLYIFSLFSHLIGSLVLHHMNSNWQSDFLCVTNDEMSEVPFEVIAEGLWERSKHKNL